MFSIYKEFSSYRRELVDIAETEEQARGVALRLSRGTRRPISVRRCAAAMAAANPLVVSANRLICVFRGGVLSQVAEV